jgi:hypothetical protein
VRKTICEDELPEFEDRVEHKVRTNVPTKYLLIDTETGQVYRGRTPQEKIEAGGYDWAPIKVEAENLIKALLQRMRG